jgi:phosphoadenosine phosphosulfate reductase
MTNAFSSLPVNEGTTDEDSAQRLERLKRDYGTLDGHALLAAMIEKEFAGKIAISSSFGAEAAVLLKLVSDIDKSTPVLFLDTGFLFDETLHYKETIAAELGLTNIQAIKPDQVHLDNVDPDGTLHERDTDYCCHIRKVLPFETALAPFDAWVSGRKRFQNSERSELAGIELDVDGRFKINPLYNWGYEKVLAQFKEMDLPRHPLVAKGYPSIGCYPCTRAVKEGEDQRAGRWSGQGKTECGIHKSPSFSGLKPQ